MKNKNSILNFDFTLIFLYLILLAIGWLTIYTTSKSDLHFEILDFSSLYGKQLIFIALSVLLIIIIVFLDSDFFTQFSSIIYIISVVALLGLFLFGKTVNGATSWYAFGNFSLQPSEFAKIGVALGVAKLLGDKQFDMKMLKNQLIALLIILIPSVLIILQPDQGSALVFLTFFFVFYREGLPQYYIFIGFMLIILALLVIKFSAIVIAIVISLLFFTFFSYVFQKNKYNFRRFWVQYVMVYLLTTLFVFGTFYIYKNLLPKRHKVRIDLTLGISQNVAKDYNTLQAKIAIGSGGLLGQGYLKGSQTHGKFVPEQETDYIFSAIAEEWGFVGSTFVIVIYMLFILRIVNLAETQKSKFSRVYGYGVASIFLIHFAINIGMVIGIVPTIGIPLPFMSYGGSSLWAFTILLFIFIRLNANKASEW